MPPDLVDLDIAAATHASRAAILARQQARWVGLLEAAMAGSAFYRHELAGIDPRHTPSQDLPGFDKSHLMQHFDAWVTDPRLNLKSLRSFTADPGRVGQPWLGRYAVWESSGSTGEPTLFVQDRRALAVYDALESMRRDSPRPWQRLVDPLYLSERVAFVGAIDGHFASEVTMRRLRRAHPWRASSWRSFSILQGLDALGAELEAFAPSILATYPSAAQLLASRARAQRLRLRPQEVWTGGENLTLAMRADIKTAFGCAVRDSYGASEFLPIAWECGHGRLHVNADWVLLEPVDEQGRPAPAGTPSHTTLLSNLANHVQPIIRLDIGDRITLRDGPCACASSLPVVEVQGRCDDALTMDGRAGEPVTLLPLALVSVLEDEAGVSAFVLEQTGARSLRLQLRGSSHGDEADACRRALHRFARLQGLAPLRLQVVCGLAATPGRSGKRQRIVALADDGARQTNRVGSDAAARVRRRA